MKKRILFFLSLLICVTLVTGCSCSNKSDADTQNTTAKVEENVQVNQTEQNNEAQNKVEAPAEPYTNGRTIVIDPGHQTKDSSETEPVGPGSKEMKLKDTSGTTGVVTGLPEYELNRQVSFKLKEELEKRGYKVILTRTQNEGRISCIERAEVANNANADAFIRIHANGVDGESANGVMTICQTSSNPYNGNIYSECKRLSVDVLDELVAATGAKREYVWETDSMTGNNWSRVPVTLVEMGYMSNPREDRLMATDDYQWKIVSGIANGIDRFFNEKV